MNNVNIIGRLTRDPQITWSQSQTCVARFSVAINRGKDRDGNDRGADYPNIVVIGKQAENCERYLAKGRLVGIQGKIQTGSYTNRDGVKVYTTDVLADRVEFLDFGDRQQQSQPQNQQQADPAPAPSTDEEGFMNIPDNIDDELPFC
jgi:single-strand DNA-binding protein